VPAPERIIDSISVAGGKAELRNLHGHRERVPGAGQDRLVRWRGLWHMVGGRFTGELPTAMADRAVLQTLLRIVGEMRYPYGGPYRLADGIWTSLRAWRREVEPD
jgi:hypothetical protein